MVLWAKALGRADQPTGGLAGAAARAPMPDKRRILGDLWALIEQDWRNIEAGYYARRQDGLGSPVKAVRGAVDFFADLSAVERRRHGHPRSEF